MVAPSRLRQNDGEVVLAQAGCRGGVHPAQVERMPVPQRVVPPQRVSMRRVVTDPVGVAARQRGEPGVKAVGGGLDGPDPDVAWQHPAEPPGGSLRRC